MCYSAKCILFIVTFYFLFCQCVINLSYAGVLIQWLCSMVLCNSVIAISCITVVCGLYYRGLFLFRLASVFSAPHLMTWFSQQESGKTMTAGWKLDLMYRNINFRQTVHSPSAISLHFLSVPQSLLQVCKNVWSCGVNCAVSFLWVLFGSEM